jgi:hypothetical protein
MRAKPFALRFRFGHANSASRRYGFDTLVQVVPARHRCRRSEQSRPTDTLAAMHGHPSASAQRGRQPLHCRDERGGVSRRAEIRNGKRHERDLALRTGRTFRPARFSSPSSSGPRSETSTVTPRFARCAMSSSNQSPPRGRSVIAREPGSFNGMMKIGISRSRPNARDRPAQPSNQAGSGRSRQIEQPSNQKPRPRGRGQNRTVRTVAPEPSCRGRKAPAYVIPPPLSAASTRASRKGIRRSRTPVASKTAFATAAMSGLHTVSPAP